MAANRGDHTTNVQIQTADLDASRTRLAALELQLASRERELVATTHDLQQLQSKYLTAIGAFYRKLVDLEAAIVAAEIRAGLRAPEPEGTADEAADDDGASVGGGAAGGADGCSNRGVPSVDLKAMYRNLARSIHPDLALDEPARWRRHSLMAEANRAYAERDEDRLRLILHHWEQSPEWLPGDGPEADDARVRRRIAFVESRLRDIDAESADLRTSAIWQLKQKLDAAQAQGWDLFAEMVLEVQREVRRATARLASLGRGGS